MFKSIKILSFFFVGMVVEFDLMYNVLKLGLDSIGWARCAGD